MARPHVFIGSSREGLPVAEPLAARLESSGNVSAWNESNLFTLSHGTLESLAERLQDFDFAVLVLTADDVTNKRGRRQRSARDNVLFECGLFVGALGRSRTFLVCDREVNLPSDLVGVTVTYFDGTRLDSNPDAAVRDPYIKIAEAIKRGGVRMHRSSAARTSPGGAYTGFQGRELKPQFRRAYRVVGYLAQFVERRLIEAGGKKRLVTPGEDRFSALGINSRAGTWQVVWDDKGIYLNAVTSREAHPLKAEFIVPPDWPPYDSWEFAGEIASNLLDQIERGASTIERPRLDRRRSGSSRLQRKRGLTSR
jgi:hypothetical protein